MQINQSKNTSTLVLELITTDSRRIWWSSFLSTRQKVMQWRGGEKEKEERALLYGLYKKTHSEIDKRGFVQSLLWPQSPTGTCSRLTSNNYDTRKQVHVSSHTYANAGEWPSPTEAICGHAPVRRETNNQRKTDKLFSKKTKITNKKEIFSKSFCKKNYICIFIYFLLNFMLQNVPLWENRGEMKKKKKNDT